MHVPFHDNMHMNDTIAAELLDLDDPPVDVGVGVDSRAGLPSFCNDECDTEFEILTGEAET